MNSDIEYYLVKNDRMFNLSYKYSDDQIYVKAVGEKDMTVFNHPFITGRDIRGLAVFSNDPENEIKILSAPPSKPADMALLYEVNNTFHLAGIVMDKDKAVWDIILGKSFPTS